MELEEEQMLMLEADQMEQRQAEENGIFSSSTLAALKGTQGAILAQPKAVKASGPLVAYDSDSD